MLELMTTATEMQTIPFWIWIQSQENSKLLPTITDWIKFIRLLKGRRFIGLVEGKTHLQISLNVVF